MQLHCIGYVAIENTQFTDMIQVATDADTQSPYGLIDVRYNRYQMKIKNVIFSNLVNFSSIFHCRTFSQCNMTIENSMFYLNDFDTILVPLPITSSTILFVVHVVDEVVVKYI